MSLVLTARPIIDGPIWMINDDTGQEMKVEVVSIQGQQCKLAFTAGDNITILRDVVYQRNMGAGNK